MRFKNEYSSRYTLTQFPVTPCSGWTTDCDVCDAKFGKWLEANDDHLSTIPYSPGVVQVAVIAKNQVEVCRIRVATTDLRKVTIKNINVVRRLALENLFKVTIVFRFLKAKSLKDCITLFAHWYNHGTLPRAQRSWPGMDLLEESDSLHFCESQQRWYQIQRNQFWKKLKISPKQQTQDIPACNWQKPCNICDSMFDEWSPVDDSTFESFNEKMIMVSAVNSGNREVIYVGMDDEFLHVLADPNSLQANYFHVEHESQNSKLEVRYMTTHETAESDACCYLFAHWLNNGSYPTLNSQFVFVKYLNINKSFVFNEFDRKWCLAKYSRTKLNKCKRKHLIVNDIEDDYRSMSEL